MMVSRTSSRSSRRSKTNSISSKRSLRSNSVIDPSQVSQILGAENTAVKKQKKTQWPPEQIVAFIAFLAQNHASSGDNNFRTATFNAAAAQLNQDFPISSDGVKKTASNCSSKWFTLKRQFEVVRDIRFASGLHYDDQNGATVSDNNHDVWLAYCKTHNDAHKYGNTPFPYYQDMEPLMPSTAKGKHVFRPGSTSNTSSQLSPKKGKGKGKGKGKATATFAVAARSATSSDASGNLIASSSHTRVVNNTSSEMIVDDPNSIAPSTPSTFLSGVASSSGSNISSIVTSISRQKRKSALSGSDLVVGSDHSSRKRARPLSVTAQAQVDASGAMQKLSTAFENFYQEFGNERKAMSMAPPPASVPAVPIQPATTSDSDDITGHAALALAELPLNPDDMNDLAEYMLDEKNKKSVQFFLTFPPEARKSWVEKRLREIHANHSQA